MYAYILIFVSIHGVTSYSPPVASVVDCNIMKQAVESTGHGGIGKSQCVRVQLAKGK